MVLNILWLKLLNFLISRPSSDLFTSHLLHIRKTFVAGASDNLSGPFTQYKFITFVHAMTTKYVEK